MLLKREKTIFKLLDSDQSFCGRYNVLIFFQTVFKRPAFVCSVLLVSKDI